ncbi:MbnP family copper-binding protein [Aliikangiella maris]|uniref:MbnP family copper-binding protein n=2 Tax=Aliikangiella maris TaxID=3162458 RepID=A0ABV3MLS8_9GAMM
MLLVSCNQADIFNNTLIVNFKPKYQQQELTCDSHITQTNKLWQINQFQFYISDVSLMADNQWHSAKFVTSAATQNSTERVALLGGVCPQPFNWQVTLQSTVPATGIKQIRFSLGVPFDLNHQNPMTQPSPLNQPDMFWTWQLGHKFMRLELTTSQQDWIFHLGSTGCQSASSMRAPSTQCKHPNLVDITLENFQADKTIQVDLFQLIRSIDFLDEPACQSEQHSALCQKLFSRLGIDAKQQLFSVSQ